MNIHDGIPFIDVGRKGDKWLINPYYIVRLADLTEKECEALKIRHPATAVFLANQKDSINIAGVDAMAMAERIEKTILSHKDRIAEKVLLEK